MQTYFQRIWELRTDEIGTKPSRDDYVFCHKDGTPIHTFKKGFETLITEAGVEVDRDDSISEKCKESWFGGCSLPDGCEMASLMSN